jgi:hypothetical protein
MSALVIIALGVWGALIPFVGPYFHYGFGSGHAWHYSTNRLWLDIVPGAVAVIGGLMLLSSARRAGGVFAGWLALAAGAWFAIGPSVSLLWHRAGDPIGAPMGGHIRQTVEQLGYFTGLGVLIAALAAFAMGRFASRPHVATEVAAAGETAVAAEAGTGRRGFFGRRRAVPSAPATAPERTAGAQRTTGEPPAA